MKFKKVNTHMFNVNNLFGKGVKNTLLLKNGLNFSVAGPFTSVQIDTVLDRWQFTAISAAEYTIMVDYDTNNKEIIRCLLVGSPDKATVTIYGRGNLGNQLVDLVATVNDSYVELRATAAQGADSTVYYGAKVIFQATYFETLNPLSR
jgi:hypothetical protein